MPLPPITEPPAPAAAASSYRVRVLDRATGAPVPGCKVYRDTPGGERLLVGETDLDGRLELAEPGRSGQRLLALSLSYDAVIVPCPLLADTVLRARPTLYAAQNEEKAEIAASAGDFATAAELSLQAAQLARTEAPRDGRDPAPVTPTGPRTGLGYRRPLHACPQGPAPTPTPAAGNSRAAQRYERQAYEYAARSLRLEGPATVRRPDTGAVEPSPEMRRRLEDLQRRRRLPATGRLEAGAPNVLPRPEQR